MSTEFVTQNNAVVTRPTKRSIQEHLEGPAFREAVAKALPKHLSPERFIRVAITAMTKNASPTIPAIGPHIGARSTSSPRPMSAAKATIVGRRARILL